jgi:Uma2 family endonuclease
MTLQEYFAWEERQEFKHEFVDGYPVPRWPGQAEGMAGASAAHNRIVANVIRHLGNRLSGGRCAAFPSDIKVTSPRGRTRYPDVSVQCAPIDPKALRLDAPVVTVEVLSPSNTWFDQSERLSDYQSIPTMRHVLFLSQDAQKGELWARADERAPWLRTPLEGPVARVALTAIGAELALAEIYEGLEFPAPE